MIYIFNKFRSSFKIFKTVSKCIMHGMIITNTKFNIGKGLFSWSRYRSLQTSHAFLNCVEALHAHWSHVAQISHESPDLMRNSWKFSSIQVAGHSPSAERNRFWQPSSDFVQNLIFPMQITATCFDERSQGIVPGDVNPSKNALGIQ